MSLLRLKYKMRRAIRPLLWVFLAVFTATIFFGYSSYNKPTSASSSETIARVNGQDVSDADYDRAYNRMRGFLGRSGGLDMQMMVARYAFDQVVQEVLQQQAAKEMGVDVSRREAQDTAEANVEMQLKQLGEGLRGSEMEEARSRLLSMPENDLDSVERQILAQRLDEKLRGMSRPVEVQASQILIRQDKRSKTQALDLAKSTRERVASSSVDFAAVAREKSEDVATKSKGGDLGWLTPESTLPAEVVSAAFRLKPGQVSEPIATTDGYVIVKSVAEKPFVSVKKDAKEQKDDVDGYKGRVGSKISEGFHAGLKTDAKIEAVSPFAKGIRAEQEVGSTVALSEASPEGKARLQEAVKNYEAARLTAGARIGPAFEFHLGQLYTKLGQHELAAKSYREVLNRQGAAEVQLALGETLEKLNDKPGAITAYQEASKTAWDQPAIHGDLATRFRKLGRPDLAAEEEKKNKKYLADKKLEDDRRKKALEDQKKADAVARKAQAAAKKADDARKAADTKKSSAVVPITISPEIDGARIKPTPASPPTPASTGSKPPTK